MEIISVSNERVKGWARLQKKKGRDQRGEFLIEGEHLIEEAMRGGHVKELLILKGRQNPFAMEAIVCSEEVMRKRIGRLADCGLRAEAVCAAAKTAGSAAGWGTGSGQCRNHSAHGLRVWL